MALGKHADRGIVRPSVFAIIATEKVVPARIITRMHDRIFTDTQRREDVNLTFENGDAVFRCAGARRSSAAR